MSLPLEGRTALVTGAGRGVGLGIARQLLIAGARVWVNDLVAERADAAAGQLSSLGEVHPAACDVTDAEAFEAVIAGIESKAGGVDVLVHNAGVGEGFGQGQFLSTTNETLEANFALNTLAAATAFRAVLPGQIERGWGRLVQISSGAGSRGLPIGVSAYGASKAATEALVRHIAVEYGPVGVTANSLALGLMDNVDAGDGSAMAKMVSAIPTRQLGRPDEVGAAVVWLSGDLGALVTGQVIHLNGGTLFGR